MKALFITTPTVDCYNHVRAWDSFAESEHFVFNHTGINNDWQAVEAAEAIRPDVMFYIGPNEGRGIPKPSTLKRLRYIAPFINLCSDAADRPWHRTLEMYRDRECFDLQVSIDGAKEAPVDYATLTPVDGSPFGGKKDIRCGFSGSVGKYNARSEIIRALGWFGGLQIRERGRDYQEHAQFMSRCQIVLNVSYTGSGGAHHIKGRVLEAGFAGAALLEHAGSPIGEWFPEDCYFTYRDPVEAARLIKTLPFDEVERRAQRLSEEVRAKYTAKQIYTGILERVGRTLPVAA